MTLIVVKQDESALAEALRTEWGFLSGLCRVNGVPLLLERYQLAFLQNRSRYRWVNKSRQVGYSFLFALEALARAHLRDSYTGIMVSFNSDDAKEKINIARQLYEELPLAFQKKLITDNKTELSFMSNGRHKKVTRIFSHPSKAPRGRTGDVYLDELAHYTFDRDVYRGTTAVILRSQGQLTGASTPLGRRGIFWEVATQEIRPYPHHTRQCIPWWLCRFFCKDPAKAAVEAPAMATEERVAKFGMPGIVEQFDGLSLEDFGQEFECVFVDESYAYYPYDIILPCTHDDVVVAEDVSDIKYGGGRLVAGYDVGRTRDASELAVFEHRNDERRCVLLKSFERSPFAAQESELRRLLNRLPIARLSVDNSGIGMNLAENLAREFPQVSPETFTNSHKERLAVDFKILLQRREVALPKDRKLVGQIHSIKRRVLPSGKASFDAERSGRNGHADRFWAVALACQLERDAEQPVNQASIGARILG